MGLNNLYTQPGYAPHFHNEAEPASISFSFDDNVLKAAMKRLYDKTYNPLTEIDEDLFNEFWTIYNQAADEGLNSAPVKLDYNDKDADFYDELIHNNGVFAAFKTHRFANDMASKLTGEDGKLKSFTEWERDTASIRDHHKRHWLETEYNTAVRRAHLAAEWRQFEREKDILPNLEWMETTAITPGEDHVPFWHIIRPVDDPFWNEHRPGDRWGCKCGLRSTEKDVTPLPPGIYDPKFAPAPGLDNNPGRDAMLFSFSHPYFAAAYWTYKKLKPVVERLVKKEIQKRRILKTFKRDEKAGKRLLIHPNADHIELEDNIRTGRAMIDNFPRMKIKIREHVRNGSGKNPEYEINGFIADAKRVESPKGISVGFSNAIKQGCEIVIIDFDKHFFGREVSRIDIAKRISWRKDDFESGAIKECYIIHNGRALRITNRKYANRDWIKAKLKKLGM